MSENTTGEVMTLSPDSISVSGGVAVLRNLEDGTPIQQETTEPKLGALYAVALYWHNDYDECIEKSWVRVSEDETSKYGYDLGEKTHRIVLPRVCALALARDVRRNEDGYVALVRVKPTKKEEA